MIDTRMRYGNTATCPICGKVLDVETKRTTDGWHDVAFCCNHFWYVDSDPEFRHPVSTERLAKAGFEC